MDTSIETMNIGIDLDFLYLLQVAKLVSFTPTIVRFIGRLLFGGFPTIISGWCTLFRGCTANFQWIC